jgi:hypothetical protein
VSDGQQGGGNGRPELQHAIWQEPIMMPYQSYQLWAAERSQTIEEQHAADMRLGEAAAALSRLRGRGGRWLRDLRPLRVTRRVAGARMAARLRRAG